MKVDWTTGFHCMRPKVLISLEKIRKTDSSGVGSKGDKMSKGLDVKFEGLHTYVSYRVFKFQLLPAKCKNFFVSYFFCNVTAVFIQYAELK